MPLTDFDHVNIRTANLDAMVAWYDDVLGLRAGWRPDFAFPGAWLYLGDRAVIHLVGQEAPPQCVDPQIEHVAFRATDRSAFEAHLTERGIAFRVSQVTGTTICQVNVFDPDGNHLHVDFDLSVEG